MTVYFLKAEKEDIFKIGYTARPPMVRLNQVQANCPYRLSIFGLINHAGRTTEREIHGRLAERRINGEWFRLTNQEAREVLADYGVSPDPSYIVLTFDTGVKYCMRLKDHEIFVDMKVLRYPSLEWLTYFATGDIILAPDTHNPLLNIRELEQDDPRLRERFQEIRAMFLREIENDNQTD